MNFLFKKNNKIHRLTCIALLALGCHGLAKAAEDYLHNCPLKKGDTLASVKEYYRIGPDPQVVEKPSAGGSYFIYQLREYGVTVYFDENKLVQDLRFERPFAGKVAGLSIGEDKSQVTSAYGEPVRKTQALPDTELLEARWKRKLEILDNLPDPAPKDSVRKAFAAIEGINALPYTYSTAWIYKNPDGMMLRFDISSVSNRIQSINSQRGATQTVAGARAPAVALKEITQQTMRDFFQRADQSYNKGKIEEYLDQYADNCVISINGKVIANGKQARKRELFPILMLEDIRLSETVVHSVFVAPDGQSATANVTATERYRMHVGDIRTVAKILRPVMHNFATIDERTVNLALVDGAIKIVRDDILSRDQSENSGK